MPRRVARAVTHLQRVLPEGDGVVVIQPARGGECACRWKAIAGCSLWQSINPKLIAFMGAEDRQTQLFGQVCRGAGMVNVGVGDPDLLQGHAQLLAGCLNDGQIATRVDDGGFHGLVAPNDGAILLEWGDGNGFVLQHAADGSSNERL